MAETDLRLLLDGIVFPESPRWHDDRLWLSDVHGRRVYSVTLDGEAEVVAELDDCPSGLGFLPDGTPIVVLQYQRVIVRLTGGGATLHADLTSVPSNRINDMVVLPDGHAYVSCAGTRHGRIDLLGELALVAPSGEVRVVATGMPRPNGIAVMPDGRTLISAAFPQRRLTAATIEADGSLSDLRVFAHTPFAGPDGICLDADGAVWMGGVDTHRFFRVAEGGEILAEIVTGNRLAIAPMLGGPDRTTLLLCTAQAEMTVQETGLSNGFVELAAADVAGAGWPG